MVSVSREGRQQVTGGSSLKGTQTYPVPFGAAVANIFLEHRQLVRALWHAVHSTAEEECTLDEMMGYDGVDDWADARLHLVFDALMQIVSARYQVH